MKISMTSKPAATIIRSLIRFSNVKARFKTAHLAKLYIQSKGQKHNQDYPLPNILNLKSNVQISTHNEIPYIELNPQANHSSIIIYLHGGAFVESLQPMHIQFCDRISYLNEIPIFIPSYSRLPYSNAHNTLQELKALLSHLNQTHPSKSIILMGDSAGGWLALSLASILKKELNIDVKDLILLSPWCDLSVNEEDSHLDKLDPILSHVGLKTIGVIWNQNEHPFGFKLEHSMINAIKLHCFVGTHEILYHQIQSLHKQAQSQGLNSQLIEAEGMFHDFMFFPFKESNQVLQVIDEIINN
jgi:acetyl esterase/lipase